MIEYVRAQITMCSQAHRSTSGEGRIHIEILSFENIVSAVLRLT